MSEGNAQEARRALLRRYYQEAMVVLLAEEEKGTVLPTRAELRLLTAMSEMAADAYEQGQRDQSDK